jgi:enoyl-CoA hydratase/carnithine racemase
MRMEPENDIAVTVADRVAVVTIDRPAKRNALNLAMWKRLRAIYADLAAQGEARVVVLTGAGGHFCAGADISEFDSIRDDAESGRIYEEEAEAAVIAIRDWPGPTVAAISGYAMGGGCGLALACDLRVGDATAKMGIPAARLGILYGTLDCTLLYRQVGLANAKRVLYAARPFAAEECAQIGLLDIMVEADALAAARALAADFAHNAPLTLRGSKTILEACAAGTAEARNAEIQELIDTAMSSADYAEGRRAFADKRTPKFTGR